MGLDAIDSGTHRPLESVRVSSVPPAVRATPRQAVPKPPNAADGAGPEGRAAGAVPRRLAVPQQLPPNTRLHIDEESNRVVAQVLDENNEVIRQIPPEALLELSTRLNKLEGLLFNRES